MRILFYITLFLSLLACDSKEKKEEVTPLLFPDNTQMLFRINDKDNFLSAIANNTFWKTHNPHQLRPHEVKLLNSIPTDDNLWVAFDTEGHFFAITPRISNDTISFWRNADTQIQKQAQFGKEWFYTIADNNLVIGDSETVSAYQQLKQENLKWNDNENKIEHINWRAKKNLKVSYSYRDFMNQYPISRA